MSDTETLIQRCDVARRSSRSGKGVPGWVYVLENPAAPGVYKIGKTRRKPTIRLGQHNALLGHNDLPAYLLVFCVHTTDHHCLEAEVHQALNQWRLWPKETFKVNLITVKTAFTNLIGPLKSSEYCSINLEDTEEILQSEDAPIKRAKIALYRTPIDSWMEEHYDNIRQGMVYCDDVSCLRLAERYYASMGWKPGGGERYTANGIRLTWWRARKRVSKKRSSALWSVST